MADFSRPPSHSTSTSKAPRARRPLTRPVGQADGQGGEELDDRRAAVGGAAVRLHEHLRDAGGHAEVAVDLERRVGVEEVGVDAAPARVVRARRVDEAEQVADQPVRPVPVAEASPQVHLPGHRPAGAVVAPQLERAAHRLRRARASPRA